MHLTRAAARLSLVLTVLFVFAAPAMAQEGDETVGRDPAYEQEIYDRLEQINPEAVPVFQRATYDMDQGNFSAARGGFQQVLEMANDFPDAARRLSSVEIALGDVVSALSHAQTAYRADPSAYNRSALAYALLASGLPSNLPAALGHASAAAAELPDDPFAQYVMALTAYASEDVDALRQSSAAMIRLFPDDPLGHFFAGVVAADDGRWLESEAELLLSQEFGMPSDQVQQVLDSGVRTQARIQRALRAGSYGLAGWAGGLVLLFAAGLVLSSITLREVTRSAGAASASATPAERAIRAVYRVVITVSSAYFYVSIPLLILAVLGLAVGAFYLFLELGQIPVRLMVFIGLAALYTIYALVRSVTATIRDEAPGRPLPREQAPGLWSVSEEVAKRLRTEPIQAVYVTPGTSIGVMERGGTLEKMRGGGERSLVLGLGALPGMTQGQFRAILAHEYGHFSNRDTAGGTLALRVKLAMQQLAHRLAMAGQARIYNPAWLFVNGFYRIFQRITLGASRLQEILADRFAALAYSSQGLASGLTHVVRQSLSFNMQVSQEVGQARETQRPLSNLYNLPPIESGEKRGAFEDELKKLMERPTSTYDSHPAPKDRLQLLAQIQSRNPQFGDADPAWDLLPDPEQLQTEMTALVQKSLLSDRSSAGR